MIYKIITRKLTTLLMNGSDFKTLLIFRKILFQTTDERHYDGKYDNVTDNSFAINFLVHTFLPKHESEVFKLDCFWFVFYCERRRHPMQDL